MRVDCFFESLPDLVEHKDVVELKDLMTRLGLSSPQQQQQQQQQQKQQQLEGHQVEPQHEPANNPEKPEQDDDDNDGPERHDATGRVDGVEEAVKPILTRLARYSVTILIPDLSNFFIFK